MLRRFKNSLVRILDLRVFIVSLIATLSTLAILLLIAALATNLANRQLQDEAFLAANSLDLFFMDLESQLETLSDVMLYTEDVSSAMKSVMDEQEAIFSLLYTSTDGNVILQRQRVGRGELTQVDVSSILPIVDEQDSLWGEVSSEEFGVPFISLHIAVKDETQMTTGILIAEIDLTALWNTITSIQLGESGYAYLIDDSGYLLAYQDIARLQSDPQIEGLIGISADDLDQNHPIVPSIYRGLDNEWVVSHVQHLQTQKWITVVEKPLITVFRPLVSFFAIPIFFLILVIAIVLDTNRFIRKRVGEPLKSMRDGVLHFQDRDINTASSYFEYKNDDEIGILAQAFNSMMQQISNLVNNLEQRVDERTRDLSLASDVSRQITTELELQKLLETITALSAQSFKLHCVSIFLYDSIKQEIYLVQSTRHRGNGLIKDEERLALSDKGLVSTAARTKAYQSTADVQDNSMNALLPGVHSELAIPMLYRGKLIGVIDLQSDEVNHFRNEEISILVTLSEQIAIAIANAQLFTEIENSRKEAEKSNKVKSAFLASMSHELRTPLNAILNLTRFVANGTMGSVNDEQQHMLENVITSGGHLLNLINDILDMSKIESGALVLFVTDGIVISDIVTHIISVGNSLLLEKDAELRSNVEGGLPTIRGDEQRITQILLNVISNACKFTESGVIELNVRQDKMCMHISISDTGPGIAEKDIVSVFEPFKQTETGLRQGGGTGLGMPITKTLVELHGGDIWVDSVIGEGSTFHISLPIKSDQLVPTIIA